MPDDQALLTDAREAILEAIGLAQQDHAPYAMRKACTDRWRSLHDAIAAHLASANADRRTK